ncbi:MAG TPA: hypothetical protein VGE52_13530 [Pirellulales bacterium]
MIALDLDHPELTREAMSATGTAFFLQASRPVFEEFDVPRKLIDHGHGFPASSVFLQSQPRDAFPTRKIRIPRTRARSHEFTAPIAFFLKRGIG